MRLISASSFYRAPHDERAYIEDGTFINVRAGLFGVADGCSEAYSPQNPPMEYKTGLTGGQTVAEIFCIGGVSEYASSSAEGFLLSINRKVYLVHDREMGLSPGKDDVGEVRFVVCRITEKGLTFVLGGDCFLLCQNDEGMSFFTNFDENAFRIEDEANQVFAECLQKSEGNKGRAWDIYHPHYRERKLRFTNKNIGKGGSAALNGDPALEKCWTVGEISASSRPRFVLLGSDGLLPSQTMNPKHRTEMTAEIGRLYTSGGLPALLKWRDETEQSLPHIQGWPEASAVELKFSA